MTTTAIATPAREFRQPSPTLSHSRTRIWTGRILRGLAALFLLFDSGMKLVKPPFVVQASAQMGYPESSLVGIGVALLACTLLYMIPRTALLGAVLLTGYLGGAVASQVRAGAGWFPICFPILFAALAWGGLWLADARLKELLFRREAMHSAAASRY